MASIHKRVYCRCEPRAEAVAAISAGENFAGEKYWSCMKPRESSCGFFQWDKQPALLPVCDCGGGRVASFGMRKADKAGFFSCGVPYNSADPNAKRCRYFEFVDPETQPIGRKETLVVARPPTTVIGYDNGAPVSMDDYRDLQNLISTLKRKLAAQPAHASFERARKQKNYNSSPLSKSRPMEMSQKQKQQQQSTAKSSSASSSKRSPMSVASTAADDSEEEDFPADAKELLRHKVYGRAVRTVFGALVGAVAQTQLPIAAEDFGKSVLEDFASLLIEVYDEAEAKREGAIEDDEEDDEDDEERDAEVDEDEESETIDEDELVDSEEAENEYDDEIEDDDDEEEEEEEDEASPPSPPALKKRKRSVQ